MQGEFEEITKTVCETKYAIFQFCLSPHLFFEMCYNILKQEMTNQT
jgi:hypothetical protein